MKINCIAIEDEPLALKKIEEYIRKVDYLNFMKGFSNSIDAIGYIKENTVDLIFLDIRMKKLTGIQFLESLKIKPKAIITSAYDKYALKGYELEVDDYLLKPYTFERFLKSVDKIYDKLKVSGKTENNFFFVKTENKIEKVLFDNILFIRGMKDYLQIHTTDKRIMTLLTFKDILETLPGKDFQRVHNSYIVAIPKIDYIEHNRIKIGEHIIPVSNTYKEKFYSLIKTGKKLI